MTIKLTKEHCQDYHEAIEHAKSLEAKEKRICEEIAKAESDIERIEGAIVEANENCEVEIERRAQARVDGKKADNSPLPSSEALEGELSVAEAFLEKLQEKSKAIVASKYKAVGSVKYRQRVSPINLLHDAGFSTEMQGRGYYGVFAQVNDIADLTVRDLFYLYHSHRIVGEWIGRPIHYEGIDGAKTTYAGSFSDWLFHLGLSGGIEGIDEEIRKTANIQEMEVARKRTPEEIMEEIKRIKEEKAKASQEDAA